MSTLEQERARFALEKVEEVKARDRDVAKYKTQLLKLPARLHNNGLGQTVGYLLAQRQGAPEWEICAWLEGWLERPEATIYPQGSRLIDCIAGGGDGPVPAADLEHLYRRASAEARALANWLKRFAEAFLAGEAG